MRFIHIADVHLGAVPDKGYPWSEEREKEIWRSFQRVICQVGRTEADLLLIAGDLFHRQPLKRELKEVNYLFSTIPDTKVILMAGNHDYLKKDSFYQRFPWNPNVYCLWGKECGKVCLEELDTCIYGLSYYSQEIREPLYDHIRPVRTEGCTNILLAHGGDERHIPIHRELLQVAGFDYVALGHIHKPDKILGHRGAYAGALEPLDRNDTGQHGYVLGECNSSGTTIQFVPFACRSYIPLIITVDPEDTQLSVETEIRREIQESGRDNIFQIFLEGFRDPDLEFILPDLYKLGNIVEVLDDTQPDYDFQTIREKYEGSLIGEYVAHFMEKDRTIIENKALYYGLRALLGEE